ncbi:MAG: hypothetical protein QW244_03420 [Candidatus Pacearchaeota archaeon]
MRCYIIAFGSGMDSDWSNAVNGINWQGTQNYKYNIIDRTLIVLVSNNINLSPAQLFQTIKRQNSKIGDQSEIYILRPGSNHPPAQNYRNGQGVIDTNTTSGQFVTKIVNLVLGNNIQNLNNYIIQANVSPLIIDPLIIIFTEEAETSEGKIYEREEWINAIKNTKGTFYNDKLNSINRHIVNQIRNNLQDSPRVIEFRINNYTILFVKENELGIEKSKNGKIRGGIDNLLWEILNKWGNGLEKNDIYVAIHALNDYLLDKSKFENKVAYICDFHHSNSGPNKEFLDLLNKFLSSLENNHNDIEQICNDITEKIKELSLKPEKSISIFKHRVMSLLSALDIDIQTLIEKNFDDDYWKKLQKIYNGEKIEGIFKDVKEIVYGDDKKSLKSYVANILLQKLNSFSKISEFLPSASEKLTGDEDLNALLIAFQNKNKTLFKNIINLHGNVYHKWLNNLIGAFEELKLEIDDKLNKKV